MYCNLGYTYIEPSYVSRESYTCDRVDPGVAIYGACEMTSVRECHLRLAGVNIQLVHCDLSGSMQREGT